MFFQYFSKTLKFPFLSAGSAITSLVKGMAAVLDDMVDVLYWLRKQFMPSECEEQYLRRFAESRSIKRYSFESAEQYRDRIFGAYIFYALAGRVDGIKAIFEMYGLDVAVQSLRDEDPERWAEFYLIFASVSADVLTRNTEYIEIINDVKPARSKLAGIKYNMDIDGDVYVASGLQTSSICIVQPAELEDIYVDTAAYLSGYIHTVSKVIIGG
ncbi:MAG: phage tail protein [Deferribacterales bacterium]